jgi:hypothetical protein
VTVVRGLVVRLPADVAFLLLGGLTGTVVLNLANWTIWPTGPWFVPLLLVVPAWLLMPGVAVGTANAALADLRHLVRSIHPPILTDRGLAAALAALAADCAVPVDLDLAAVDRLAPATEAAAYFAVAEALANAAKHAGASRSVVTIGVADGRLRVRVVDDGRGGADPDGPSG